MRILSLQTGRVRRMEDGPRGQAPHAWRSATLKEPQEGARLLSFLGVDGDEQADRENHGGEEKAVLLYSGSHYARWNEEFPGAGFGGGGFGENLTVDFIEEDIAIGDVLRIGGATVEISQPRVPCWKQAWRWGIEDLVERMQGTGRTGFYARVLEPGDVRKGDEVLVLSNPYPDVTVARLNRVRYGRAEPGTLQALADCPALAEEWRRWLRRQAGA